MATPTFHEEEMRNKRHSKRAYFGALAKVYDYSSKEEIGYLGDISTRGFMLFTNREFPVDGRQLVVIHLPHPEKDEVIIHAGVQITWQRADFNNPHQHCTGCKIVALSPKNRLLLLQAAQAFGISS